MFASMRSIAAVLIGVLLMLSTGGQAMAQATGEQRTTPSFDLSISEDGTAIVDQNGTIIARFAPDTKVQMTTRGVANKLPGCFVCNDKECIVYDGPVCIKYYRSCTWDFDCKQ